LTPLRMASRARTSNRISLAAIVGLSQSGFRFGSEALRIISGPL
jgi:hypothetical protein